MSGAVRVLPYGPRAVLAEYGSLADVMAAAAALRRMAPADVVDIVPAASTILVTTAGDVADAAQLLMSLDAVAGATDASAATIVVPVRYDGVDLDDVARRVGLTVDDVVTTHAAVTYTVAFCGFMPGFSYLVGLDPRLHLPRRETPRTKVPRGAVAIASEYSAVYPDPSPGGWHLLGTTDAVMWDEAREVPARLPPGARVRFEPT